MAPDSFWARRGLRLERPSEDFGTVVTQGPVARFERTPTVAGDTPRIFGQGQPDGWTAKTSSAAASSVPTLRSLASHVVAAITASTNVLIAAKPCAIGTSTSGFGLIGRCCLVP